MLGEGDQPPLESRPAADQVEGNKAEDDDAKRQEDALGAVNVGDRAQPAGCYVDKDDDRKHNRPTFDRVDEGALQRRAGRQAVEQQARCLELDAEIGHAEDERDDDGEEAHRVRAVVVAEHLARRDIAKALAQKPLALEEQHPGEGDGDGVEGGKGVGQADVVDGAGVADEGPAAKGSGGGGEHEDPQADTAAGDKVIRGRLGPAGSFDAPEDAVRPVADGKEQ